MGVVSGLATAAATAQTIGEPAPGVGDRIRIRTLAGSFFTTGRLLAADADTITLAPEGRDAGQLSFARSEIARLDVFQGRKSYGVAGGLIGASALFVGALMVCSDDIFCNGADGSDDTAKNALAAAGAGGLIGGLLGMLIRSDRWTSVPVDRVRVAIAPVRARGVALSVSVGF